MSKVRDLPDEDLEALAAILSPFADTPGQRIVTTELARRAEIRMERQEYGEMHDASWYRSRQTEEQWLAEMGQ